jgi:ABC-2 type transport system ATP-binding protein
LKLAAAIYRVADYQPKAEDLLRQFELVEKRDTLTQELSRGMRQKVAVATAYLHDPRAILFDEPLTGLDPRGIRTLKDSIRSRAAAGASILVSSHLLALVEDLCTHLLMLHKGQALYSGPIGDVRAAFAGSSADASLEEVFFKATEG